MVEGSGGRSQLAHLATAGVVALVLVFLTGPLQYLAQCVLGAIIFSTLQIKLLSIPALRDSFLFIYGGLLILVMLYEPGGLVGVARRLAALGASAFRPDKRISDAG